MSVKLRRRSREGREFYRDLRRSSEGQASSKAKTSHYLTTPLGTGPMNKTSWIGIALLIYGIIVLIGATAACPAKHASISVSVFMILTGLAFFLLGKDLEKLSKGVEKAVTEKAKEAR